MKRVFISICSLYLVVTGLAHGAAFPGALGFGANATGGRNGSVYHVTSTADSGSGTFRDAVSQGNRIIVFDVGGTITLASPVSCSSDLTIAGQTAPGGIAIIGHEVSFSLRTNEIVRYLRIRPGSLSSSGEDDINVGDGTNMVFDHDSLEFAGYNNIDAHGTYGSDAITVQSSIIGDPMYNGTSAKQGFGAHTEHLGGKFSWYDNIWVSEHNRQPLAKIDTIFVNNTEYNFQAGYTVADTSGDFHHDIIGNYFVTGPTDPTGANAFFQMNANQIIYGAGNMLDNNNDGILNGGPISPGGGGTVLSAPWSPLSTNTVVYSAAGAFHYDTSWSGAMPRDPMDALILSQINTLGLGTAGTGGGTAGPGAGLYYDQTSTGLGNNGYGTLTGGVAPVNTSGDGLPDYWKLANGLNTNQYYPLVVMSDGYTLLEDYINWLAEPHAVMQPNGTLAVDLGQYTAGYTNDAAVYMVTSVSNGTAVLQGGHVVQFSPPAGFVGMAAFQFRVSTADGSGYSNVMGICVSPVPAAQGQSASGSFFVSLHATTSGPSTESIAPPEGGQYSAAAPVPGTTWNTVDLKTLVGTNSAVGSVSNLLVNGALVNTLGNSIGASLTVSYSSVISTGTRTQPSGASGENTLQPGGVMASAWRNYYNAGGNYLTFTVSGLSNASPYDLYLEGGTTTSGQGTGVALAAANQLGANATTAVTTNTTANSNGSYGSLWTVSNGSTNLMPEGTTWEVLHGQSDATGHFSFEFNGSGSAAYLNGFQLAPVTGGPANPEFRSAAQVPSGGLDLAFTGVPGFSYRLWATTNLTLAPVTGRWTLLAHGIFSGTNFYEDNTTTQVPARFYQISSP